MYAKSHCYILYITTSGNMLTLNTEGTELHNIVKVEDIEIKQLKYYSCMQIE